MPEYLHPGVYIEEQPAPQSIAGVSTSTAGFVGAAQRGPTSGLPQLVVSFDQFLRRYGSYLPEAWGDQRYLAYAVDGFFRNGGQRAYIVRVVGPGAAPATLTLNDGFVTRLRQDTADTPAARTTVVLESLRGIDVGTQLRFEETIGGQAQSQVVTVTGYNPTTNSVSLSAPLSLQYTAAGALVTMEGGGVPPAPASGVASLNITASSEGEWGRSIQVTSADSTGPVGLAQAASVRTNLRAVDLTLTAAPQPAGAPTDAVVDAASLALLHNGDVVEFAVAGQPSQSRTVTKQAGNTIDWPGQDALPAEFGVAGVTIRRLTAIRGPVPLAFDAAGPAAGDDNVDVDAASFALLEDGDVVEFSSGGVPPELRTITKAAGTQIDWAGGGGALAGDYSAGGSIRLIFAGPVVPVEDASGLGDGDLVRVTGSGGSEDLSIDPAAGSVDAASREIQLDANVVPTRTYLAGDALALATAGRSASNRLDLASTNNFYAGAVVEIDDGTTKTYHTVNDIAGRSLVFIAPLGRDVASGATVRTAEFTLTFTDGTLSETFARLSMNAAAAKNFVVSVINRSSQLVRVALPATPSTRPVPFNMPRTPLGTAASLTGGDNGALLIADNYRGVDLGPGLRTGIQALQEIDDISIMAVPGISDAAVQAELIGQCEILKDRFAVLDPMPGSVIGSGQPNDIQIQRGKHDSYYAAMYYPWLRVRDPLYPDDELGKLVPPSGYVLGIYARVDSARGVHKAPANEVVRGLVTGVEVKLGDREQDILNPDNINVLRDFRENNRGIRVWGSRVLTAEVPWQYIPVRRLFIFVEESLDEGLQWVVFEPNAEPLWARVIQTVRGFLNRVWRDGALAGTTEDEAFFIRCDRTTMTEDDRMNGRLIVLIGIAPVRPAEFVIVRISQKTLEATA